MVKHCPHVVYHGYLDRQAKMRCCHDIGTISSWQSRCQTYCTGCYFRLKMALNRTITERLGAVRQHQRLMTPSTCPWRKIEVCGTSFLNSLTRMGRSFADVEKLLKNGLFHLS